MSCVTSTFGRSLNSSHESATSRSTWPQTRKSHVARSVSGTDPGVEHGPLVGQVLARRQPRRVVAGLDDLLLRPRSEEGHAAYTSHVNGVAIRPRSYVAVRGPDAEDFLQRMVSNDVSQDVCEALLLTAKARVIAPLVVWRRADGRLPAADRARARRRGAQAPDAHALARAGARSSLEEHTSHVVLGGGDGIPTNDYGTPAVEVLDAPLAPTMDESELERLRVLAGTPRWGREIDDRILPAEAGLDERAISFTKGCYPGQEPVARLHHRGHANRDAARARDRRRTSCPAYDAELSYDGKVVGRVTSAVRDGERVVALAYVRREVPEDAELELGDATARALDSMTTRP